jgi:hypothetical protein
MNDHLTSPMPDPPPDLAADTSALVFAAEPSGNKGCMVFLAFLLILPPFIFLFAFPVLFVLVGAFFGWLTWLPVGKLLRPTAAPWKVWLGLTAAWLIVMLAAVFLIGNLESLRQLTHTNRY